MSTNNILSKKTFSELDFHNSASMVIKYMKGYKVHKLNLKSKAKIRRIAIL